MKDVLPVQEGEKTQNYEEQVEALTLKSPFLHPHPQQEQSPHTNKQTTRVADALSVHCSFKYPLYTTIYTVVCISSLVIISS